MIERILLYIFMPDTILYIISLVKYERAAL